MNAHQSSELQNSSDESMAMLEKLAKLHEQEILSDEEYQQKKNNILARI